MRPTRPPTLRISGDGTATIYRWRPLQAPDAAGNPSAQDQAIANAIIQGSGKPVRVFEPGLEGGDHVVRLYVLIAQVDADPFA